MICPFATELLKTEKRIVYDENGKVIKVMTLNTPKPQPCQEELCPFYTEGSCRKVEDILGN